jgi:excisionase family DNA binding protein
MDTNYLTPTEVARRLRVDATTVRRWIANGALEAETDKQGRRNRHRIKLSVIEAIEQRDSERHRKLV